MSRRQAFTLIELLVVIAIICALAAMLIPVISMVRERAYRSTCSSNLRTLTLATFSYMQDNEGFLMHGGTTNHAANGIWYATAMTSMEQYLVNSQQANSSAAAAAPFRYMHCPANTKGITYSFVAGQPYDYPATLERVVRCAQRWNAPGGMPVLWMDNCNMIASSFAQACNHKDAVRGIPSGGNCSFSDGSVAWLPYLGNVSTTERAYIINGGTIGPVGIPSCEVWIRLDAAGNLDPNYAIDMVMGRTNLHHATDF